MASHETKPCDECGELIDPTVAACPECGNEPAKAARQSAYILLVAGIVLSITGIGAVLGVPFVLIGIAVLLALWRGWADYSPTEYSFSAPF